TNSAAFVDNRGNDNSFFVDSKLDDKDLKGVLFATISTILADQYFFFNQISPLPYSGVFGQFSLFVVIARSISVERALIGESNPGGAPRIKASNTTRNLNLTPFGQYGRDAREEPSKPKRLYVYAYTRSLPF
ncbi:MAG: hypothetical protein EZS28_013387, partial [Streblomastix strix]